jgi:hypothetical protein
MRVAAAFVSLLASVGVMATCSASPDGHQDRGHAVAAHTQPIIDGTAAPELTGVVHVRHPLSDLLCSGVVIAPTLVITAKHCAFREIDPADEPLSADGFRIGFGPDTETLTLRGVEGLGWVGAPDEVDVQTAIDGGEDVAVLRLTETVPPGTHIHPVDLDYVPALEHTYELAGYGISSLDTWDSGTKRVTTDVFVGYDAPTGIIQIEGNGACNGDSGGPVLFGADASVVGVISQIGGTDAGDFCTIGTTFATTVRNDRVRSLLEAELAALPPCEEREEVCANGQDENCNDIVDEGCSAGGAGGGAAGGASGAPESEPSSQGGEAGDATPSSTGARPTAGTTSDDEASSSSDGCNCRAPSRRRPGASGALALAFLVIAFAARRGRRR